jgi:hypothetical protein
LAADEGQPHADETVAAHCLQRGPFHLAVEDRGTAQPRPMGAKCRQDVVVIIPPRTRGRDHRAVDAVLVERRDQLVVGEAVFWRVARIVDQRHVGGEDMHMGVDLETVGHRDSVLLT